MVCFGQCEERSNKLWNAAIVRRTIVNWLEKNGGRNMDDGSLGMECCLMMAAGCETKRHWKAYCKHMSRAGKTWGDEVTLVAACAVFGAHISVISSLNDDCIQVSPAAHSPAIEVEFTAEI